MCDICCDEGTLVSCLKCEQKICHKCLKRVVLEGEAEPACCNCQVKLPLTFLISHLGNSWYNSAFKAKRKVELVSEVKQNSATYLAEIELEDDKRLLKEVKKLTTRKELSRNVASQELKQMLKESDLQLDPYEPEKVLEKARAGESISEHEFMCLVRLKKELEVKVDLGTKPRATFVQACPDSTCKGMLSSQFECSTCKGTFCSRCFESKVQDHTCNEDLVKTMEVIKSTSKKCPRCSEQIEKESGCDQMWCPTCKVAFSWRTGEIETGYIHNPHYFQYLRATKQEINRAPGDEPGGDCENEERLGGLFIELVTKSPGVASVESTFETLYDEVYTRLEVVRRPVCIKNVAHAFFRSKDEDAEAKLATNLVRLDTIKFKNRELCQIYETLNMALRNILLDLGPFFRDLKNLEGAFSATENLVRYINQCLVEFEKLTKLKVQPFEFESQPEGEGREC